MKEAMAKLQSWFEGLNTREKWLVGITALALILFSWDSFLYAPRAADNDAARAEIQSLKSRITTLETTIVPLRVALQQDPDRENKEKVESLKQDIGMLQESIKASSAFLVTPRQMAYLLEDVLEQNQSLEEVRIQGLPAEPLFAQGSEEKPNKERIPLAYRQPLEIVFRGSYADTLSYLQMVEALPWKYYWQSLVLQSGDYPEAVITLRVNTLSLDREWIGG
jgi:MSHA biogenesis protein MshJ